ncbi:ferritin-like domain-containing protein [Nocardia puris]|uniref:Ferritin-like domain-containing protein n=1 Tax=Nocardia puris TaxID=208602 RepID=A0A366DWK6_9NOCA|nr:ferritin-like domain-containing protein [Nocardia puris]MBF6210256.1 ferritin-like domain-containing protein [Nocardia puris]MBF6367332.1 ferritin-like domain-containing protein [Nocardia puris]MBF6457517.1 ferritin-like domain-containing protein [Nocardia puris]RBO93674.1 hypothetical protein DFR74_10291 [Nocardia puris]
MVRTLGGVSEFGRWTTEFEAKVRARVVAGDPDWGAGARLDPAVVRSLQRFQVGESGDGAQLIGKAERAGDPEYARAVRLFVAEESNHARLLELLLRAAGAPTVPGHWSDTVFVWLRRALGLRLEVLVLMVAEVVAVQYYRALRDGVGDPLTARVAALILDDELRHIPFHCLRLRLGFARTPRPVRLAVLAGWWVLVSGASVVVALDHGPALRTLGHTRIGFVRGVLVLFAVVAPTALSTRRS